MTEPVQKKKLSKGCIVGLIVAGVLVLLIVVVVALIFIKGDEMAAWAMTQSVENEKKVIMAASIEGIDTIAVNNVADAFLRKLEDGPELQTLVPYSRFVQDMGTDDKVDSAEVTAFINAMIACYPDLAELEPDAGRVNDAIMSDTASSEDETD